VLSWSIVILSGLSVLSGIPQGTVLGLVLFIHFIDDIVVISSGSVTHELFADDVKLYSTIDRCSLQSALIVYTYGAAIGDYP